MRTIVATLMLCLLPHTAFAANHYVRDGAAGAADGTSWTDAWDSLPATLTRGDTYYMADGNYPYYDFDDTASGTTYIYVKKAIEADHGTETGWDSAYGNGAATWTQIYVATDYYDLDGQVGGGPDSWASGHGFEVYYAGAPTTNVELVEMAINVDHVFLRHFNIHRPDETYKSRAVDLTNSGISYITIEDSYLHSVFGVHLYTQGGDNIVVKNSYMYNNKSTAAYHSESFQLRGTTNVTIAYNKFELVQGTGIIMSGSGVSSDWDVHGNIFIHHPTSGNGHGTIADNYSGSFTNIKFHNNTIVGGLTNQGFFHTSGPATGNAMYNNVFYNSPGIYLHGSYDYNTLYDSSTWSTPNSNDISDATGDPFVDSANSDYHLDNASVAGTSLSSPFDVDMDGVTRGADGSWDRGALEWSPTGSAPSNVSSLSGVGGDQQVAMTWTNPADADYSGARVRYSTSTYPAGPASAVFATDHSGTASSDDSYTLTGLADNVLYYISVFAYDTSNNYATGSTTSATTDRAQTVGEPGYTTIRGGTLKGGAVQ